jgi:glutamyl-tRNA synthetase
MSVITRFAPSPTGYLHIGGARTALFSYLYARRHGGRFLLRIEDTDLERSTPEAVQAIFDGMDWLGLKSDTAPVYQTQRFDRYSELIDRMLGDGHAYPCYASREELDQMRAEQQARKEKPRYDGRWRPAPDKVLPSPPEGVQPVIRFANPEEGEVVISDLIKGEIRIANRELDDLIIARADGTPTYNFCVVVDDMDMGVTHVIRGDDHVNNTPRQINILRALGAEPPAYAHVSMILGADGAKLSKRHGALGVMEYRAMGFLPEAMLNYLVRLGWSHGDQELFSMEEMIRYFDFDHVSSAPARFDMEKAYWVNHQYLKTAAMEKVLPEFEWHMRRIGADPENGPPLEEVVLAQRERCRTLLEMAEKSAFFYAEPGEYDEKDAAKHLTADAAERLALLVEKLDALEDWSTDAIHSAVHAVGEHFSVGLGKVAQPIRVAVAGTAVSPPIDETLRLLGQERTIERLNAAIEFATRA